MGCRTTNVRGARSVPFRLRTLLDHGGYPDHAERMHGKIQTVKSVKSNRVCEVSPQLVEQLRGYLRTFKPNSAGLPFATRNGTPWDTDVIRKRKLYPLLDQLNIIIDGKSKVQSISSAALGWDNLDARINLSSRSDEFIARHYQIGKRPIPYLRRLGYRLGE